MEWFHACTQFVKPFLTILSVNYWKRSIQALYSVGFCTYSQTAESRAMYRLYSLTHTYASTLLFISRTHKYTGVTISQRWSWLVHSARFPWQPGYWISPCVQAQWDGETKERMFRWVCICSCACGCSLRVCGALPCVCQVQQTHAPSSGVWKQADCLLLLLLCEIAYMSDAHPVGLDTFWTVMPLTTRKHVPIAGI